mmetsp:Transcript_28431/g.62546  ORF Transcript_28431/g.62546 Transcript_28431/m.62546 type:complete len:355 (-) Transcript_28431:87-1151(-)
MHAYRVRNQVKSSMRLLVFTPSQGREWPPRHCSHRAWHCFSAVARSEAGSCSRRARLGSGGPSSLKACHMGGSTAGWHTCRLNIAMSINANELKVPNAASFIRCVLAHSLISLHRSAKRPSRAARARMVSALKAHPLLATQMSHSTPVEFSMNLTMGTRAAKIFSRVPGRMMLSPSTAAASSLPLLPSSWRTRRCSTSTLQGLSSSSIATMSDMGLLLKRPQCSADGRAETSKVPMRERSRSLVGENRPLTKEPYASTRTSDGGGKAACTAAFTAAMAASREAECRSVGTRLFARVCSKILKRFAFSPLHSPERCSKSFQAPVIFVSSDILSKPTRANLDLPLISSFVFSALRL